MKTLRWWILFLLAVTATPSRARDEPSGAAGRVVFEVAGKTRPAPNRKGTIAPSTLQPVVEVFVKPGDKVKKGQKLVKLDDQEELANVKSKKAILEAARITLKESHRHQEAAEKAFERGAISEIAYFATRTSAAKAEQDEIAAQAAVDQAQAVLEDFTVEALIDGVVAWLQVDPGMVSQPGTTVWGEIIDLSEIEVVVDVTPEQADQLKSGQVAEIRLKAKTEKFFTGTVDYVGIVADKTSGMFPVTVCVPNPDSKLRCGVEVRLRFLKTAAEHAK